LNVPDLGERSSLLASRGRLSEYFVTIDCRAASLVEVSCQNSICLLRRFSAEHFIMPYSPVNSLRDSDHRFFSQTSARNRTPDGRLSLRTRRPRSLERSRLSDGAAEGLEDRFADAIATMPAGVWRAEDARRSSSMRCAPQPLGAKGSS